MSKREASGGRPESAERKQGGRFKPGQSGNPAGRPVGARNKATLMAERLMAEDVEAITNAVIVAAKEGDMVAARLVLDRIAPVRKGRAIRLDLPKVETAADVLKAIGATVQAMAAGEVTPEEAAIVAGVLEAKRRAIETDDLAQRLAALEGAAEGRP